MNRSTQLTIADAKQALSEYVTAAVTEAEHRAEISRRVAAFVAAVVREERRKAAAAKEREIRALRAAVDARDAANPFSALFRSKP